MFILARFLSLPGTEAGDSKAVLALGPHALSFLCLSWCLPAPSLCMPGPWLFLQQASSLFLVSAHHFTPAVLTPDSAAQELVSLWLLDTSFPFFFFFEKFLLEYI